MFSVIEILFCENCEFPLKLTVFWLYVWFFYFRRRWLAIRRRWRRWLAIRWRRRWLGLDQIEKEKIESTAINDCKSEECKPTNRLKKTKNINLKLESYHFLLNHEKISLLKYCFFDTTNKTYLLKIRIIFLILRHMHLDNNDKGLYAYVQMFQRIFFSLFCFVNNISSIRWLKNQVHFMYICANKWQKHCK